MQLSLDPAELTAYLRAITDAHAPDGRDHDYTAAVDLALARLDHCFSSVALGGYRTEDGQARFDHLHGDQFAAFLYWVANSAWRDLEDDVLAKKVCLLNRARHALLVMYDTVLPDIFVIPHTVGTVIGKADYSDYTVFCQGVTIANDIVTTLTIGEGVVFFPGAFVVGTGTIGAGSVITANTTLSYRDVPPNSMVRGTSPNLEIWPRKRDLLARYFIPPYPGSEAS